MALPKKAGEWRLGRDFQRKQLQGALQQDIRPDILTNHVRYSERIDSMMPKAKYLTIIRDPAQGYTDKKLSKTGRTITVKIHQWGFEIDQFRLIKLLIRMPGVIPGATMSRS